MKNVSNGDWKGWLWKMGKPFFSLLRIIAVCLAFQFSYDTVFYNLLSGVYLELSVKLRSVMTLFEPIIFLYKQKRYFLNRRESNLCLRVAMLGFYHSVINGSIQRCRFHTLHIANNKNTLFLKLEFEFLKIIHCPS